MIQDLRGPEIPLDRLARQLVPDAPEGVRWAFAMHEDQLEFLVYTPKT